RSLVILTRPGYKMTEIGEIPEEWDIKELHQVSEQRKDLIEPAKYMLELYVGLENITSGQLKISSYGETSDLKSSKFRFQKGDILYGKLRPYLDKIALAETDGICSTDIIPIVSKNSDNRYLAYMLHSSFFLQFVKTTISGTNHPRTNWKQMSRFIMSFPPLSEQQKIAEILSTADEAIQKVNEQITLTELLKKGLMQTLLTRGIGHTKFKMTELGEMPEEWSLDSIKNCSLPTNSIDPLVVFGESYFKYIDVSEISSQELAIKGTKEIQGVKAPSRARKGVKGDDIIFATIRPYLKRIAMVPKYLDGNVCSTAFCVIRANGSKVLPKFLFYSITLDKFVSNVSSSQTGSAYPAVSDSQVLSERVVIPPLPEQQKIAEILSTADSKLELLRKKKEHLEILKKGLMNDLLTGKVRVKMDSSGSVN
ncbi:MAG: restriction endonuclease subunit S, partial [Thermoplasmata archaeon]